MKVIIITDSEGVVEVAKVRDDETPDQAFDRRLKVNDVPKDYGAGFEVFDLVE